ncbi:lysophospholipid acyltransferase family protein [Geomesophilobacter sediminis]|uniref:Lysophospholipid acyltransferase family protein n=1 Tax=Geomesophilobacter sediminis TaxID=2798584 RepID=A0A8J7J099_9BACT|nr:lysophospholipid acyltransferase family protein [Geomesophilobacter sediminis]MBJ6725957.1 lysophospholipid acyltransferase family protein [Geomesophilobacter sediminis]
MLREIRWHLETFLFLSISFAVARLPLGLSRSVGRSMGRLMFRLLKRRREVAIGNIADSLPFLEKQAGWAKRSPEDLARQCFEHLGLSLMEDCRIYHGRGQALIDAVEVNGNEHWQKALERGKGVAFVTGHCGNWELLALSFGARYHNLSVVARRQDNPHLNGVLERIRSGYGNSVIYREGALRAMFSSFKKNGIVGLLIDQAVAPEDGVLVNFLGRPAWTTNFLAQLARKVEVPLIPAFIHRDGERQVITFHPEIILPELADGVRDTQILTNCIERYVIEHPADWYWIHKRWKRVPQQGAPGVAEHAE